MTPTDEEIEALAAEHLTTHAQFVGAGEVWLEGEVDYTRAVLAKWGTPTPAEEPVGHLRMGPKEEFVATKRAEELDTDVWHAVYTAPPVREPLTEAQRNAIYEKHYFIGDTGWEIDWSDVIDEVEKMHGITKGG
jgi:hypothetical protein